MRNCCITISDIELVSGELSYGAADLCIRCSYLKKMYLIQIFNQYLLNKKDDTCRPMDTNLSARIKLSI